MSAIDRKRGGGGVSLKPASREGGGLSRGGKPGWKCTRRRPAADAVPSSWIPPPLPAKIGLSPVHSLGLG